MELPWNPHHARARDGTLGHVADLLLGRTVSDAPADVSVATSDLVTHGVIVGMTGSGKTGLGVVLIEECLANGVPAILFDPKGDLTNLALVFPTLAGPEFEPWIDPAQARADGATTAEFAQRQASLWRDGLATWGIDSAAMGAFKSAFDVTIYTPGSMAGVPLNVLGSLTAPQTDDPEVVNDEIQGYVTSLLSVVGISADPLSSREHILLSNIIAAAWGTGESIDLATLLARVQQPPMRKLGVFELDAFFPPKDRLAFALRLNGVLAAPGFQSWITGDPIDIQSMLWAADGRPRCAVITTAHLSDEDRQSATSLILSKIVTWMRRQSGTTDLRALLYMDEVAGYLPPTAAPPTKRPIMLLLKQARAFGLGCVLSTQNPVDVDYKALSNAGTWLIGRLTTERDKSRLLEGMSTAAGGVDIGQVSDRISGLGKRQFLLRKAGANAVDVFATKWARSYLRGPMTRDQIAAVTRGRASAAGAPAAARGVPTQATPLDSAAVAPVTESQAAVGAQEPAGTPTSQPSVAAAAPPVPVASEATVAAEPPGPTAAESAAAAASADASLPEPPAAASPFATGDSSSTAPEGALTAPARVDPADTAAVTAPAILPGPAEPGSGVTAATQLADDETPVMPAVAADVAATYLDPAAPWASAVGGVPPSGSGPRLTAAAAARVMLRYDEPKADLIHDEEYEAVIAPLPAQTAALEPAIVDYDDRDLGPTAPPGARYVLPDAPIDAKQYWTQLRRDLTDHLVRNRQVEVQANVSLKLYSRVGEGPEAFAERCRQAAADQADRKVAALRNKYEGRLRTLQSRLASASARADAAASARTAGVLDSVGSALGGWLGGRRSTSSIGAAARRASAAQQRATTAAAKVDDVQRQIADLEAELVDEVSAIQDEWQAKAEDVGTLQVPLEKSDVRVVDLRLVWIPVG